MEQTSVHYKYKLMIYLNDLMLMLHTRAAWANFYFIEQMLIHQACAEGEMLIYRACAEGEVPRPSPQKCQEGEGIGRPHPCSCQNRNGSLLWTAYELHFIAGGLIHC